MSRINIQKDQQKLVGILETKSEEDKRLVLIVHGEQGHKNALYQKTLAKQLPYSSFRFDFHGNGDSSGNPGLDHIAEDTEDIHHVARHFESLGYTIYAIIGFNRGSLSGLKYATTCDRPLEHYVNISTPFYTKDECLISNEMKEDLKNKGSFSWKVYQKEELQSIQTSQKALDIYTAWDNSHGINTRDRYE
ncbi:hypothetical protein BY458DRAFT_512293 [Sporodiniella umbellata]|nr:hypothetical protein BY458DRAFT_512293 [Sporodiniella umbellata]